MIHTVILHIFHCFPRIAKEALVSRIKGIRGISTFYVEIQLDANWRNLQPEHYMSSHFPVNIRRNRYRLSDTQIAKLIWFFWNQVTSKRGDPPIYIFLFHNFLRLIGGNRTKTNQNDKLTNNQFSFIFTQTFFSVAFTMVDIMYDKVFMRYPQHRSIIGMYMSRFWIHWRVTEYYIKFLFIHRKSS